MYVIKVNSTEQYVTRTAGKYGLSFSCVGAFVRTKDCATQSDLWVIAEKLGIPYRDLRYEDVYAGLLT